MSIISNYACGITNNNNILKRQNQLPGVLFHIPIQPVQHCNMFLPPSESFHGS